MKNTFQTIILGIFGIFLVGGVVALALFKNTNKDGSGVPVIVWGTTSEAYFDSLTNQLFSATKGLSVVYSEKPEETFDQDVVEALASGKGPDIILLPQDSILRYKDKIAAIPFSTFSERDFKNTFVSLGEIYLTPNGAFGLPFSIDPLVMYWNRSLFSNAGLATPPQYWDEFAALAKTFTQKDKVLNITQSLVALGESNNISHSKEILSALFMQAGNPIIRQGALSLESALGSVQGTASALNFYTEFANPVKPSYSWNRSLPNSLSFFLRGNSALYFGFASEFGAIGEKNPNLDFDVSEIPQVRNASNQLTFANMKALALLRTSRNPDALKIMFALIGTPAQKLWSEISSLPSVRRDLVNVAGQTASQETFSKASIRSRAWMDPKPKETSTIFAAMIEGVTAGRFQTTEAVERADNQLGALIRQVAPPEQ
jgi:ABC-type glycerol-3-phosphate transport system substrate-binding protein